MYMRLLNRLNINAMTVDTRDIRVPSWVFSVVLPLVIGALTYVIGIGTINAKTEVK